MLFEIFTLLVLFQLKHFVCDYPLQTQYMLGKANATNWVKPLAAHAFIHLSGTWVVLHLYGMLFSLDYSKYIFTIVALSLADFIIHFTVDRIKASPKLGGRFNPTQPYFWWALGADQMAHHLTHYLFIAIIVLI